MIKQPEGSDGVQLLDGVDETVTPERDAGTVGGLDPEAGPRVVSLDDNDGVWVEVLVPVRDRLKQQKNPKLKN